MARLISFILATGAMAAAVLSGPATAFACGSNGYSYAGLVASQRAFGISAMVTSVDDFDILHGHVAAWVGVGGPGEGPGGTNEWLEVGLSRFPGVIGSDVYYEVALPGRFPVYHQIASSLPAGKAVEVAVLEMHNRPDHWRVSLNGRPVSRPIRLPGSHDRWSPIATAESWDGGPGHPCNTFLYHFRRLELAHAAGGGWHLFSGGSRIESSVTRIRRSPSGYAFLAAEGRPAFLLRPPLRPDPGSGRAWREGGRWRTHARWCGRPGED